MIGHLIGDIGAHLEAGALQGFLFLLSHTRSHKLETLLWAQLLLLRSYFLRTAACSPLVVKFGCGWFPKILV